MGIKGFWGAGAVDTPPDLSTLTSEGYPTSGDPAKGIPATKPRAAWYYLIDQMRSSLVKAAGITPKADADQFLTALKSLNWIDNKKIPGAKIADSAISTEKIVAGAVTYEKISAGIFATSQNVDEGTPRLIVTSDVLLAVLQALLPAGVIMFYAGTVVPNGWLACNGGVYPRAKYARLFSAIGTRYGAGDGSTTFAIPKAHHQVLEATTTISEVGQVMEAGLPDIVGNPDVYVPSSSRWSPSGAYANIVGADKTTYQMITEANNQLVNVSFTASRSSALYGSSDTVRMASLRALAIIKI